MLPESKATLDEQVFANELKELADRVGVLSREEDEVRSALVEAAEDRQTKFAELQIVMRAEEDLVGDLAYLSKIPDDGHLTCPTCGQVHDSSFRAKVESATDAAVALNRVTGRQSELRTCRPRPPTPVSYEREAECQAWLRANDMAYLPWLALDDRSWLFRPFCKSLFLVNGKTGLTASAGEQLKERMRQLC